MRRFQCTLAIVLCMARICHVIESRPECVLPRACEITYVNNMINWLGKERVFVKNIKGLKCEISSNGYRFDLNETTFKYNKNSSQCDLPIERYYATIELRWKNSADSMIEKSINISDMLSLFGFYFNRFDLNFVNLQKFDLDLFDLSSFQPLMSLNNVMCMNCRFEFYLNKTLIKSCDDMNITDNLYSIFQMSKGQYQSLLCAYYDCEPQYGDISIVNGDFKARLCPLVFKNTYINILNLFEMMDTFYKRNVLHFTSFNKTIYINSNIKFLCLIKVENINLDLNLLNPNVFFYMESISIYGPINKINSETFGGFYRLKMVEFLSAHFRKTMHLNGIEWIKEMNKNLHINMSNRDDFDFRFLYMKNIRLTCTFYVQEETMLNVFPDEDFCLYEDFPFDQHILVQQNCFNDTMQITRMEFSCTFLWLTQYYLLYYKMFIRLDYDIVNDATFINIERTINDTNYNSLISKCNFEKMRNNCKKYTIEPIWERFDFYLLNKRIETALKISSYIISALSIVSNLFVVVTILHKENNEAFKDFKHYSYLCANSIFCVLISIIDILSWMTECFYPYEVFCPEIRKLVVIQLFKMVFDECLVTAFRFMCNFTYLSFALNRIALIIGNLDNHKFLKFFSDVNVKIYLLVTLLISLGLSVIKYFKYSINYDLPENSFPISNELDLSSIYRTKISNDAYIIINSISDIFNYIVFEIAIFVIDVYLVVLMRRTLDEKMQKLKAMIKDAKKLENMITENNTAIKKVIRLAVLNTVISVLFKLPIAFMPTVNVYAEFYYKDYYSQIIYPNFGRYYLFLLDSGFQNIIIECSDLLYSFSISIQLFIYINFDKKFKMAFKKIFKSTSSNQIKTNAGKK